MPWKDIACFTWSEWRLFRLKTQWAYWSLKMRKLLYCPIRLMSRNTRGYICSGFMALFVLLDLENTIYSPSLRAIFRDWNWSPIMRIFSVDVICSPTCNDLTKKTGHIHLRSLPIQRLRKSNARFIKSDNRKTVSRDADVKLLHPMKLKRNSMMPNCFIT